MTEDNNLVGVRTEKAMTPSGKISKYMGHISTQEHINLNEQALTAYIFTKSQKAIDDGKPEEVSNIMVNALQFSVDDYNSRTPSRNGVLPKILAKVSGALRSGVPLDEEKRSRLDKILGKNKDVLK